MADRASSIMGGKSKAAKSHSGKGKVHRVHIRRGDGGGFIVENHHKPDDPNDPTQGGVTETPVMGMDQLKQHLDNTMGDQPSVPPPTDPAAAQAAAPAMPQ